MRLVNFDKTVNIMLNDHLFKLDGIYLKTHPSNKEYVVDFALFDEEGNEIHSSFMPYGEYSVKTGSFSIYTGKEVITFSDLVNFIFDDPFRDNSVLIESGMEVFEWMDTEEILKIKIKFPKGTKIVCESMGGNEQRPILPGTKGIVQNVDDIGTIHVIWENNRLLGLIPNIDKFKKIN